MHERAVLKGGHTGHTTEQTNFLRNRASAAGTVRR